VTAPAISKAKELRACLAPSGFGARDFIVRVGWKALVLRDRAGNPFNLGNAGQSASLMTDADRCG
jgi:hypothetical protein